MKKILITGSTGLLGQHLCQYFSSRYEVLGLYHQSLAVTKTFKTMKIDLTHHHLIKNIIDEFCPDIIINSAGLTSVDECENNQELALSLNAGIPKILAESIKGTHCHLVQISTDHLYDGKNSLYTEESPLTPLNFYAVSKMKGEEEALKKSDSLVMRTNFYGGSTAKKLSFSSWIYNELSHGRKIQSLEDVYYTPISLISFAKNLEFAIHAKLKGIYNLAGSERTNKYLFALKIAETFQLDRNLIHRAHLKDIKLLAPRPHDMSLSIEKIKRDLPQFICEDIEHGISLIKEHHYI